MTDIQAVIERVQELDAKRKKRGAHDDYIAAIQMANAAVTLAAECRRLQMEQRAIRIAFGNPQALDECVTLADKAAKCVYSLMADVQRLTDEVTDWILVADGVKHDWRCFHGEADTPMCLRCQVERLTAEIEERKKCTARDAADITRYREERDRARQLAREWHRESGICGCDDETGDLCVDAQEMATWPTT